MLLVNINRMFAKNIILRHVIRESVVTLEIFLVKCELRFALFYENANRCRNLSYAT